MNKQIEAAATELENNMEMVYADGWGLLLATTEGSEDLARVALAAAHPTITTAEELDALPSETAIRDDAGFVYEQDLIDPNQPAAWLRVGKRHTVGSREIELPATVLYWGNK